MKILKSLIVAPTLIAAFSCSPNTDFTDLPSLPDDVNPPFVFNAEVPLDGYWKTNFCTFKTTDNGVDYYGQRHFKIEGLAYYEIVAIHLDSSCTDAPLKYVNNYDISEDLLDYRPTINTSNYKVPISGLPADFYFVNTEAVAGGDTCEDCQGNYLRLYYVPADEGHVNAYTVEGIRVPLDLVESATDFADLLATLQQLAIVDPGAQHMGNTAQQIHDGLTAFIADTTTYNLKFTREAPIAF